jgi:uncharacterized protein YggE
VVSVAPVERELVVVGEGTAWGVPDRCDLWLSLDLDGPSVVDVINGVTRAATAATAALRQAGVPDADIQTQSLMINERFNHQNKEPDGCSYHYGLAVVRRPVDDVGRVIEVVASAVGERLRIHSLQFGFADPAPLEQHARVDAVRDARRKQRS